jgi:hypothetical protein
MGTCDIYKNWRGNSRASQLDGELAIARVNSSIAAAILSDSDSTRGGKRKELQLIIERWSLAAAQGRSRNLRNGACW